VKIAVPYKTWALISDWSEDSNYLQSFEFSQELIKKLALQGFSICLVSNRDQNILETVLKEISDEVNAKTKDGHTFREHLSHKEF
jgi:FMN phosphatase YigB (HAD superfamily)